MTMRSYCYFVCPEGHQGVEKTSENDQPYSKMWERVTTTGMIDGGKWLCYISLRCVWENHVCHYKAEFLIRCSQSGVADAKMLRGGFTPAAKVCQHGL